MQFWLQQLENKMRFAGIKSQFLKLQVLTNVLPARFIPPIKSMLRVMDDEADATCYKRVKTRLLEVFGPKPGDDFEKAANLLLTDKPSMLANEIISLVCQHNTPIDNCCCENAVLYFTWCGRPPRLGSMGGDKRK